VKLGHMTDYPDFLFSDVKLSISVSSPEHRAGLYNQYDLA
jgi:hypothetical protein